MTPTLEDSNEAMQQLGDRLIAAGLALSELPDCREAPCLVNDALYPCELIRPREGWLPDVSSSSELENENGKAALPAGLIGVVC